MELPIPTMITEIKITKIPDITVRKVLDETPFHSLKYKPQKLEVIMMVAMCKIHELAPLPNLLSPIP